MNSFSNHSLLWDQLRRGDHRAFARLYENHFQALYNYGYRFSGNASSTKDAIQQLFLKLWDSRENLKTPPSIRHYLLKSLRNTLIDLQKSSKVEPISDQHLSTYKEEPHEFLLIQQDHVDEQLQLLRKGLELLTTRQREAIYLKFYENLSYGEISSTMSVTVNSVYNIISKALDVMRKNTPYISLMLLISFA